MVVRTILSGQDPRLKMIGDQLERAPELIREYPGVGQFRVGPTSTFDDLSFPLETERLESGWLEVTDVASGRELQFRVAVGRHGFLRGLEGRTTDGGVWPRGWTVDPSALYPTPGPLLTLPPPSEASAFQARARERLAEWLDTKSSDGLQLLPPASSPAIAAREQTLGGSFPNGYRTFLGITDGLETGTLRILGHKDAYDIDSQFLPAIVVAWDADDTDDFVVAVSRDGRDETVYRIDVHDPDARPVPLAPDFASFLRDRVGA
jgi:hypothetical protein